jgi:hypothetical protein
LSVIYTCLTLWQSARVFLPTAAYTNIVDQYVCDSIENFAQSFKSPFSTYSGGAVLDNDIYSNTTGRNESLQLNLLPDLKSQVQQWLAYEKQREESVVDDELEEAIFVISFGFYDLWQYGTLELKAAQDTISCSIYELFAQLDIIAEQSLNPPRIMIPNLWDITFQPRFLSLSKNQDHANHYGEQQHKMVYLVNYWNSLLAQMAGRWSKGDLFLLDWNTWVVTQIRSTQMHELGIQESSSRAGKAKPVFGDVSNMCLTESRTDESVNSSAVIYRCADPAQNLFW